MPRYYFHVRQGNDLSRDREGMDLPDLQAVRATAVKLACQRWSAAPPDAAHNDQTFEISDEVGHIVLTVPFSEAFAERAAT